MEFTTQQYLEAINREMGKRATTYPKIIIKMSKQDASESETQEAYIKQEKQMMLLRYSSALLSQYPQSTVLDGAFLTEILDELMRELKERKRCYPRWVKVYRMMPPETAAYEIAVWESLTRWFAKEFLDLDELPTKRRKKKTT